MKAARLRVTSPKGGFARERLSVRGSLLGVSVILGNVVSTERRCLELHSIDPSKSWVARPCNDDRERRE